VCITARTSVYKTTLTAIDGDGFLRKRLVPQWLTDAAQWAYDAPADNTNRCQDISHTTSLGGQAQGTVIGG